MWSLFLCTLFLCTLTSLEFFLIASNPIASNLWQFDFWERDMDELPRPSRLNRYSNNNSVSALSWNLGCRDTKRQRQRDRESSGISLGTSRTVLLNAEVSRTCLIAGRQTDTQICRSIYPVRNSSGGGKLTFCMGKWSTRARGGLERVLALPFSESRPGKVHISLLSGPRTFPLPHARACVHVVIMSLHWEVNINANAIDSEFY